MNVTNPRTGQVDFTIAPATRDDIAAHAARLRLTQPAWRALGIEGRGAVLVHWADAIEAAAPQSSPRSASTPAASPSRGSRW